MYHWVRRISLILALVVVLVLLWGQIAARLDPYALAARQMSATLADNPDLPERLEGYARSAQGTRQALGTEWSHPAVLLIDILQWSAAWDDIQQWLSRFPGANGIANSLADLVREVAALDTALAQLTVIAPGAAPYYRQFQA